MMSLLEVDFSLRRNQDMACLLALYTVTQVRERQVTITKKKSSTTLLVRSTRGRRDERKKGREDPRPSVWSAIVPLFLSQLTAVSMYMELDNLSELLRQRLPQLANRVLPTSPSPGEYICTCTCMYMYVTKSAKTQH